MAIQGKARLGVACAATLALAGCVGGPGADKTAAATGAGAFSPVTVERDVEAPDVFSLSGQGLWDGRPSLGGVWVAHASVKDPERVIIRNAKNGKSVVGALFRRERELPGPGLQVSSDAAEALGLLAGQPADLSVVALRREEKPVPADAEIGAEDEVASVTAAPEADTAAAEAVPADTAAEAPGEAAADTALAAPGDAAAGEVVPPPLADGVAEAPAAKPRGLFGFLKRKPKPEAAEVATGAAPAAIEQTALDPLAATAAAAIDRAEAGTAAPTPAPAETAALKRAFIQIGIFSLEANAERAAGQMRAAGMAAEVRSDQSNGKTYWRVIVGPAASVVERDALVARVKGVGYPDAYPVSR